MPTIIDSFYFFLLFAKLSIGHGGGGRTNTYTRVLYLATMAVYKETHVLNMIALELSIALLILLYFYM